MIYAEIALDFIIFFGLLAMAGAGVLIATLYILGKLLDGIEYLSEWVIDRSNYSDIKKEQTNGE